MVRKGLLIHFWKATPNAMPCSSLVGDVCQKSLMTTIRENLGFKFHPKHSSSISTVSWTPDRADSSVLAPKRDCHLLNHRHHSWQHQHIPRSPSARADIHSNLWDALESVWKGGKWEKNNREKILATQTTLSSCQNTIYPSDRHSVIILFIKTT